MEILDYRVVMPAFVRCKQDEIEHNLFVYIDYTNKTVRIDDYDGLMGDPGEIRKQIYKFIVDSKKKAFVPDIPNKGFSQLNPENYKK